MGRGAAAGEAAVKAGEDVVGLVQGVLVTFSALLVIAIVFSRGASHKARGVRRENERQMTKAWSDRRPTVVGSNGEEQDGSN